MQEGNKYQQKKDEILRLIKSATPIHADPPPLDGSSRTQKILFYIVIACLLGTMIPVDQVNAVFSVSAMIGLAAILILGRGCKGGSLRWFKGMAALFVAASLLSGCSGKLFSSENIDILKLCDETKGCRIGVAHGISILGYPISRADLEMARQNGGIETVRAAEVTKGYGLVSFTQVKVWGDSQEG